MFDERPPTPWRNEPSPWREPAAELTAPILTAPAAPPPAPQRKRRTDGLALILIGALIGGAVGIGGARALTPQLFPASTGGGATGGVATGPASTAVSTTDGAAQAAIKSVIQQANEAQATAFANNDPTPMQATATAQHYTEMVRVNSDLAAGGVRSIALVRMTFGDITVNGSAATATTTETWTTTFADGSTGRSTDENDYALILLNGAWTISANTQPNSVPGGLAPTNPQGPTSGTVRTTSRNWSGYVATGGTYSSVTGTWVVPTPDPKTAGIDATWVGIGGATTTDLIQGGTEATVHADGTVSYDAWTETLPQSTRTVSLTVSAGDTVTVTLTEQTTGLWRVDIKDATTGKTYTTTIRYSSSKASAEWIQEAPSFGRGIAPLDSFGTVPFTGASAVVDGARQSLKAAGARAITMTDGAGQPLAIPSSIGGDGSSFEVNRTSTPSTGGGTGGFPGRRRG